MKSKTTRHGLKRMTALLLAVVLCVGMVPSAFAAQEDNYHDPAEHWIEALNRTNELDANSVVTIETFTCCECGQATSFQVFRVPEYTRNGETALTRNVKYSDGTCLDGESKGDLLDGTPGQDAYYTGYHWTKAVCQTCGTFNTNMGATSYACGKNVYWLYDCAADFFEELPEEVTVEQVDSEYHRVITTSGEYCAFCYGTFKEENSTLERHAMESSIRPELAHDRFVEMDACADCGYAETAYTVAKAVIADYFGVVDGQPHTVTVSDLSEAGVTTAIRYGHSADACTLTSAPNYTEAGDYPVYYEITYTYHDTDMVEDGVAFVHLRDETTAEDGSCTCGCDNPDCGCQDPDCDGCCCDDKGCGENHNWTLLDSTPATCLTLGYDRYLCVDCGMIEKRDYEAALGHAYQSVVVRDATCEVPGKTIDICERCGNVKETNLPQTEHEFSTTVIPATCTSPGYTLRECTVCGERHIEDITAALPHNYVSKVTPATCEGGGRTLHICEGCGSSFITDYTTEALAVLMPFKAQEILHQGGVYYGQNTISKNLILANRWELLNANGFVLGVSGSGKSFTAKREMVGLALAAENGDGGAPDDIIVIDPESEYRPLIEGLGGEVIEVSATSPNHINAMDMEQGYGDGENPVVLKSEFLLSLCEQLMGSGKLSAKEKSIIDRCAAQCYREYIRRGYTGAVPTLQDFHAELLRQPEPEARDVALAIELFTEGSLNTFAKPTNVDTNSRILCYDIRDLGRQLLPVGMLVVLDSIFNRIIRNRQQGRNTWIYIDEIYLLFQHEYSANFLFTLWKRVRKYRACCTGITQNVDDLLQSHTARTMLANSEFLVMLNQAATDRTELARLLNISDNQLSYITNVDSGRGLIKCGSAIVPFMDNFPKNRLYKLMTTKPSDTDGTIGMGRAA